jgi:hypothetical protein
MLGGRAPSSKQDFTFERVLPSDDEWGLPDRLKRRPEIAVNVGKCQYVHAVVLQVRIALHPTVIGKFAEPWLAGVPGCDIKQAMLV